MYIFLSLLFPKEAASLNPNRLVSENLILNWRYSYRRHRSQKVKFFPLREVLYVLAGNTYRTGLSSLEKCPLLFKTINAPPYLTDVLWALCFTNTPERYHVARVLSSKILK